MWIRRKVSRLLARLGVWFVAKLASEDTKAFKLASAQILAIDEKLFVGFDYPKAQRITIQSDYSNITQLTAVLRQARLSLENGHQFDKNLLPNEVRSMSVEDFFIDFERRYIDAPTAVVAFKKEAQAFLTQYFAIEKAPTGLLAFHHRVMSKLLKSCTQAAEALKQFSYEP